MKYTHILWDFNGTILDDVNTCIKTVNSLLSERGYKTIDSVEEYHSVFGFPVTEYYKKLGFDFEKESYDVIAKQWVSLYLENVKEASIFEDVREKAEHFKNLGLYQVIISATEIDMLKKQLADLDLINCFDDVWGMDNIRAESKVRMAERWREKNPNAVALMIGDTLHDAEVAKTIGADCILVARGHQSYEALSSFGCPVVNSLSEIIL